MSWELFKKNLINKLSNASNVPSIEYVAKAFADEYDKAIKNGGTIPDNIKVTTGNVETMEKLFLAALQKGLSKTTPYDLVGEMGKGVKAYWATAQLAPFPLPIPTPVQITSGVTANLVSVTNKIDNTGIWKSSEDVDTTQKSENKPKEDKTKEDNSDKKREKNNKSKILIVGDSITVDNGYTWSSLFKKLETNTEVEILAIGGKQLITWMAPQLQAKLAANSYDRVYIYGGINDAYSGRKASAILNSLQSMVNLVVSKGSEAVVVTGYDAEIDMGDNSTKPTKLVKTKEEMEKLLAEYRSYQKSIDTIKNAIIVPKISIGILGDGFHPTGKQPKKLYEHISKY